MFSSRFLILQTTDYFLTSIECFRMENKQLKLLDKYCLERTLFTFTTSITTIQTVLVTSKQTNSIVLGYHTRVFGEPLQNIKDGQLDRELVLQQSEGLDERLGDVAVLHHLLIVGQAARLVVCIKKIH